MAGEMDARRIESVHGTSENVHVDEAAPWQETSSRSKTEMVDQG